MAHINPRPVINLAEYDQLLELIFNVVQANRTEAVSYRDPRTDPTQAELARTRANATEDELWRYIAQMTLPPDLQRINDRQARNRRSADV